MPKKKAPTEIYEWSYPVEADEIGAEPRIYDFSADEQQRIDVARRLNLVELKEAVASVTLQRAGGMIHAIGSVSAQLTQSCITTLAPVPAAIEDEFESWFGDKEKAVSFARAKNEREAKKTHTEMEILEESVDPEPIVGGMIDLGELATQYLSLAIEPYPRAEGAPQSMEFGPKPDASTDPKAGIPKNPFEALKNWKEKR